ncbi:MAG TPA: hypothetical protein PKE45_22260 [Caldilineaceae bacterium]|nr:hypothetical protein [Caldilineaceae bacterium]
MTQTRLAAHESVFLSLLNANQVEYLVIGSHAVAYHGYRRPIADLDVWVATGALLHTLSGHTKSILSLDFSPTEPILASTGWDGAIRQWNTETGAGPQTLRAPGPYGGMNISGVTGITEAQKAALVALGAVET